MLTSTHRVWTLASQGDAIPTHRVVVVALSCRMSEERTERVRNIGGAIIGRPALQVRQLQPEPTHCVPLACQHPRPYPLSPPTHPQLQSTMTCGSPFPGHGAEIPEAVNFPYGDIMPRYVVARYGCPYRVPNITALCQMSGFPGGTMTPEDCRV